ncbi:3-keto-5-aminohexanoate cleavage protein [Yoonia sp. GPGPB17]|uniref:3-keto-5-aminohexanoate cleavage protein n=1 Tax=Yoonia sp. GPGPB17 TaxID=3026147 RepID=UPI0030C19E40
MVAPNGARLLKTDHPEVPLTQAEIVECAKACFLAGADGIHAHIRDDAGRHLLNVESYRKLLLALQDAVPEMAVQITTEAVGIYDVDVQMDVALRSGATMVSAAVREICRAGTQTAASFYNKCADQGIAIQHILYDKTDCALLESIVSRSTLMDPSLQILFVLGRHSPTSTADPADLAPFLRWLTEREINPDWAVCAFGTTETECLSKAFALGGKCRVGFENSRILSSGSVAKDNAQKVADLKEALLSTV